VQLWPLGQLSIAGSHAAPVDAWGAKQPANPTQIR
jgi:hypothetical protein